MFAQTRSFTDLHEHAGAISGWRQTYDQMGRGPLNTGLSQVCGERFQLFQESFDNRIAQHGQAPRGRMCIAVVLPAGQAPIVQKQLVGAHSVMLLRPDEDFVVQAPAGTRYFGATVDLVRFAELAAFELSAGQLQRAKTLSQLEVPGALIERLLQRIYAAFQLMVERDGAADHSTEKFIEDTLLETLLDLFSGACDVPRGRQGNIAVSAWLVKRSQELALARLEQPPSILDLCAELRVSRRTLQNSFQAVTGMRPIEYLRNLRLNAVRRKLRATAVEQGTVGEIAGQMGFSHLSHFSLNYRELFGEYPSQTKRQAGSPLCNAGNA